jgi:hypothetical protein
MRGNAWSRGAEEFDALLSGSAGDADQYADLLDLVASLRATPPVSARPEFVASLRTQLVAAAERAPVAAESDLAVRLTPRQRRGSRERRLAALVGGFAVVSASGSMAMAAQDALPGDVLYPVKRAIENAQTNLQRDGASKADTLIAHAEARLDEVQELAAGDGDADMIASTLQDFTDQTTQASEFALDDYAATGKTEPIAELRAFASDSMDVLGALGPILPDSTRSILITATQTVRQVDSAAWEACPGCADNDIAEVPDFALQSLTKVLNGPITDAASVTKPGPDAKPTKGAAAEDPSSEPSPSAGPTSKPSPTPGGPDLGPVDDLTKVLDPIVGTPTGTDKGLAGTLVDGVTGVLGGLGALLK